MMRNPIFGVETKFLDQSGAGEFEYLTGDSPALSCGERIIHLTEPQRLIRLDTKSGQSLLLSPETLFGLVKDSEGRMVRYAPVDTSLVHKKPLLKWSLPYSEKMRLRSYVLGGMMCANGNHLFNRHRASSINANPDEADGIIDYVKTVEEILIDTGKLHDNVRMTVSDFGTYVFIRSRALTVLVGDMLTERMQSPSFYPDDLDRLSLWAFLRGLLSTSERVDGSIVFKHRDATTVRRLAEALWNHFGVPVTLRINKMEAEVMRHVNMKNIHRFVLSAEGQMKAVKAGLIDGPDINVPVFEYDEIKKVTPIDEPQKALIVMPGQSRDFPLTANSFMFNAEFSLPEAIVSVAAHPSLNDDTSDPTRF